MSLKQDSSHAIRTSKKFDYVKVAVREPGRGTKHLPVDEYDLAFGKLKRVGRAFIVPFFDVNDRVGSYSRDARGVSAERIG